CDTSPLPTLFSHDFSIPVPSSQVVTWVSRLWVRLWAVASVTGLWPARLLNDSSVLHVAPLVFHKRLQAKLVAHQRQRAESSMRQGQASMLTLDSCSEI